MLFAKGVSVDADPENRMVLFGDNGPSRLRFYSGSGERINCLDNAETNILSSAGNMRQELREQGLSILFMDGAELFGSQTPVLQPILGEHDPDLIARAEDAASRQGAAQIGLHTRIGDAVNVQNLTVYRGGFWRYVVPSTNAPLPTYGVLGVLEFRDGKGRLSPNLTHLGNVLASFPARSGISNGGRWNLPEGGGHMPPGWYHMYRRLDFRASQRDVSRGSGNSRVIRQGSYVRWEQDDATGASRRYTNNYIYNAMYARDRSIGLPTVARFKWQLEPIPPNTAAGRTQLQIHPDGRKNGTMGCIGIQTYNDCLSVNAILQRYHQLSLMVEIQTNNEMKTNIISIVLLGSLAQPLAMLTAQSLGLPNIATLEEIARESGVLSNGVDPDAIIFDEGDFDPPSRGKIRKADLKILKKTQTIVASDLMSAPNDSSVRTLDGTRL
jgi:hypothetical protein